MFLVATYASREGGLMQFADIDSPRGGAFSLWTRLRFVSFVIVLCGGVVVIVDYF